MAGQHLGKPSALRVLAAPLLGGAEEGPGTE